MPCNHYLTTPIKNAIVDARKRGQTVAEVAEQFNVVPRTVLRLCKRAEQEGDVSRKPKSGRPRKTSEWQDRAIVRDNKKDPNKSGTDAVVYARDVLGVRISAWTARRILKRRGLYARRPARKPLTTKKHRKARLEFARRYRNWTVEDWGKVLWSDEAPFHLYNPAGGTLIRRPLKMRYKARYIRPTVKFRGGNIMVWGKGLPKVGTQLPTVKAAWLGTLLARWREYEGT